jgi:hypothetical protein
MTERDATVGGTQHTGVEALIDRVGRLSAHGEQQLCIERRRSHRGGLDDRHGARCQLGDAREHDVSHRVGHRRHAGAEELCDVERIAGGQRVERGRVDVVPGGESLDALARERVDGEPLHAADRCKLTEHDAKRVRAIEFIVPVRRQDERRRRADPPAQDAEDVEGRLVCPVDVLEHDHERRSTTAPRARRRPRTASRPPR